MLRSVSQVYRSLLWCRRCLEWCARSEVCGAPVCRLPRGWKTVCRRRKSTPQEVIEPPRVGRRGPTAPVQQPTRSRSQIVSNGRPSLIRRVRGCRLQGGHQAGCMPSGHRFTVLRFDGSVGQCSDCTVHGTRSSG